MRQAKIELRPAASAGEDEAGTRSVATIVCIAGMHRSGTSMVAHLLHLCGVDLGPPEDLGGPAPDNLDGFWENVHFVKLNEQILSRLGGGWDLPPQAPEGWESRQELDDLRNIATSLVRGFERCHQWGWKDPRNSLTFPFWRRLVPRLKLVFCVRNPLDVAHSLQKRGNSSLSFGLDLWLKYNRVLLAAVPRDCVVTHYESYFHEPTAEVSRVLDLLDLGSTAPMIAQACRVASLSLCHHSSALSELLSNPGPPGLVECYTALCAAGGGVFQSFVEAGFASSQRGSEGIGQAGGDPLLRWSRVEGLVATKWLAPAGEAGEYGLGDGLPVEKSVLVAERDLAVEERDAACAERDAALAAKAVALRERQAALEHRKTALFDLAAANAQRDSALGERDAACAERDAALAAKAVALRERQAALDHCKTALLDLAAANAQRDSALGERDAACAEQDVAQAAKAVALRERQAALDHCKTALLDLAAANAQRDSALGERNVACTERDAALTERAAILDSTSWRVTAPARSLIRLLRRLLDGGTSRTRSLVRSLLVGRWHGECAPVVRTVFRSFRRFLARPRSLRFVSYLVPESQQAKAEAAATPTDPSSLVHGAPVARENAFEVLCLPIIDWDFRFQRPQQLMSQFAAAGHRVFYVAQTFREDSQPYLLQRKAENVYEVSLRGPRCNVYRDALGSRGLKVLFDSLNVLRCREGLGATAVFVQVPFWWPLAKSLSEHFAWPVVYDCMDYHAGFSTNHPTMLAQEKALLAGARLVVVSSALLETEARRHNDNVLVLRNGCEHGPFAGIPSKSPGSRPVIGYYGAIADWFDCDLVANLAESRPEWHFVLVGSTYLADTSRLELLPNVELPGEQSYSEIPAWLARFDVAIMPFRRTTLTEATNPIKVYEVLASGKPLVAVPIPEVAAIAPLVRLATSAEDFEREISAALSENDPGIVRARRDFAARNTWRTRFQELAPAVAACFPRASLVVVTFNSLALTRACLGSILTRTEWPNLEIFVVDNASGDGTREFLEELGIERPDLRLILNDTNAGFAAANNQALREATGEYLALLNNDTVVARGWLAGLIRHLASNPEVGLVGPVTNWIGNEAQIPVGYGKVSEMPAWAAEHMRKNDEKLIPIRVLAMFCVAMKRETFELIGELDDRFGIGMFEDDDYALRIRRAGLELVCAEDVFVHHEGKAAFRGMEEHRYQCLFAENRRRFEDKWGIRWKPHQYRSRRDR